MTTLTITKAYTSKAGLPASPVIGDKFYTLTAEFDVVGTPKNAYTVGVTMADRYVSYPITDLTPGHKKIEVNFRLDLDDTIPWLVELDPFDSADAADPTKSKIPIFVPDVHASGTSQVIVSNANKTFSLAETRSMKGSFSPVPPANAIDFYEPRWLIATQGSFATFGPGTIDELTMMIGIPITDSWQKVLSTACRVDSSAGSVLLNARPVDGPTEYPVYFFDHKNLAHGNFSMIHQCALEVRNQRVNAATLRTVTWADLDAVKAINIFKAYASPETKIESNDKKIADFVTQTLGANYHSHFTPYDAARKLFQAVLAHTVYTYPTNGGLDLRPKTAVGVLEHGLGDCGGFSILLVAVYRHIGFPARTACGAWAGLNEGHCWCEMWFPGHGWMVSDGSAGNGACEDGSFAHCFGSISSLNGRYACMRGNTFAVGSFKADWLQGPNGPNVSGVDVELSQGYTDVRDHVTEAEAKSLVPPPESKAVTSFVPPKAHMVSPAFNQCPCATHGGFRPRL